MARLTIDVDLPPEVEITGYQRYQDGHGLEVRWPLPARCRCEKCGHDDVAHIEFKTTPQAIRDLNLWEQPCFWIYQAPFHRCARCNYSEKSQLNANDAASLPLFVTLPRFTPLASPSADDPCTSSGRDGQI